MEQAKGVLAERWQVNMDDAFTAMPSYARNHQLRLTEIAKEIAEGTLDTDQIPSPAT
ncbi:ANTAR domain-containing protein [Streptomyces microflavus]|uniref:ANTAR domain-containing protein n=1 Tax=Streptomyces microflavus TaxID=1919 RepID=UPI00382F1C93